MKSLPDMEEIRNIAEYVTVMIDAFSKRHGLTVQQSYRYISRFHGIDFLQRNYEAIHTLDFEEALEGLTLFCHRNGGNLI